VKAVKRGLNWLGYYTPQKNIGMSLITDQDLLKALKEFQADQNLSTTSEIRPDDET
jgi:hypothetical protein|tara:strand:- start:329 stop:496 length:168 start_codon:yes stop_codon:yes gene_type:complete